MNTSQTKNLSLNLINNSNNCHELLHDNSINSQNPTNTYPNRTNMDNYLEPYFNNQIGNVEEDNIEEDNIEEDNTDNALFSDIRYPPPIIWRNYNDPNHTIDSDDDPIGAQFERGYYWSGSDSDISVSSDTSLLNSFRFEYQNSDNE